MRVTQAKTASGTHLGLNYLGTSQQAGSQLAGRSLFVVSRKPSNGHLGTFKPWWDINYQGLLFSFSQDSRPGFDMSLFIPWFYLVGQGFLFTIE